MIAILVKDSWCAIAVLHDWEISCLMPGLERKILILDVAQLREQHLGLICLIVFAMPPVSRWLNGPKMALVVEWAKDGYEDTRTQRRCGAHLVFNAFWLVAHFCVHQMLMRIARWHACH